MHYFPETLTYKVGMMAEVKSRIKSDTNWDSILQKAIFRHTLERNVIKNTGNIVRRRTGMEENVARWGEQRKESLILVL